ncbi:MAG: S9 family peptidase, partial [Bacteroidota bacterium]
YDLKVFKDMRLNVSLAGDSPGDVSKDNRVLYYTSDKEGEFSALYRYDIQAGTHEPVEVADWDIGYSYFSHGGKYRIVGMNVDGKTVVRILDTESGETVELPVPEGGSVNSVSIPRNESSIAYYVGSSASPQNLYTWDFSGEEGAKLTNTLNESINPDDLVLAEVVRFKSFDELEIPAIFYRPKQASAENKVPAIVLVHGGPGGQSRQSYRAQTQYLVNNGYAVLAVNNRGSSGYGKTFFQMDDQKHGEEDLKDCIAGKDWLAQQDYIDPEKIGIMGGSYGGYMVMRAMTHTPEEFAVGVNIFGVTNWLRTLRSIPPWWESFKEALYKEMGDPNTADSVRHYNISPLFHADQVKNPVMVLQGAQDPRVLQIESDEMVEAIKAQGVPVEYLLFPEEGHGFVKKENQQKSNSEILAFLDKYLKQEDLPN